MNILSKENSSRFGKPWLKKHLFLLAGSKYKNAIFCALSVEKQFS